MRRNSDPWFRFYVRTLNNPKVQQLAASDFKGWVNLLCLAKEYDGALPPVEDIAFRLRLSKRKAETLLKSLEFNGLIDGDTIHDWGEMQYASDSSTERVKRHRERQRNVPSNVPTVPHKVPSNVSETVQRQNRGETETKETETEAEVPATKTKSLSRVASADTWDAYNEAYTNRYGVEPTRNRKVNSQLKQFCERVPIEEAPAIASFYLTHNNAYYIRTSHSTDALLKDAEKLRTEWQTGRKVTSRKAMQDEGTATNFENAEEAKRILRRMTDEPLPT